MNAITTLTTAGGTVHGPLSLSQLMPIEPANVVTRAYVDTVIATTPTLAEFDAQRDEVRRLREMLVALGGAATPASPAFGEPAPRLVTHSDYSLIYTAPYFIPVRLDSIASGFLPLTGGVLSGPLTIEGLTIAATGRVVSQNAANNPSFTCWDTTAGFGVGMWMEAQTLVFGNLDGGGAPLTSFASIANTGLYLNTAAGYPGLFGLFDAPNGRALQFSDQWSFFWNQPDGRLIFETPLGATWVIQTFGVAAPFCYNTAGQVGGQGAYINLAIDPPPLARQPATAGLAELLQLNPIRFSRRDHPPELGFLPEELRAVIPEAVIEIADMTGLRTGALDAAVVNAFKELDARLRALEGGGATLPAREA
jgi:hypothetical protein